jgi:membrane-associated phospholipid phosphatase
LTSGEECAPPPPTEYSEDPSSQFYAEAMEVYLTGLDLTPEQKMIALFWADDPGKTFTPPGHSISIATQVLRKQNASLALAAETYAKVGIAVADAFIGCWNTKYIYNLIRPITYIRAVIDAAWNNAFITDPVNTPPFPEYASGHSVQSGAAATVLTSLFGDNYQFTDETHVDLGLPARTYPSFFAAADEAAISRLYGGIHFRSAIEFGIEQGQCIGDKVNALAWGK